MDIIDSVCMILHHPPGFPARSCFGPLVEQLGARAIWYEITWEKLAEKSWTLGYLLRQAGNRFYGSEWNALVPFRDEIRFSRNLRDNPPQIVHFLWGEFASPRFPGFFRRRRAKIIGSFHCSARRQPSVLAPWRDFREFDWITVMSKTQIPFFVERGFPESRIRITPLGVDADYFNPKELVHEPRRPVEAILVGNTERDHEFMADVMRHLPKDKVHLRVRTSVDYHSIYRGIQNVELVSRLSDDELLALYQNADLMVMPLLDCTSNDAILEAMACGTPVMVNAVGGISEYVDPDSSFIMENKNVDQWVESLTGCAENPVSLHARRNAVRRSALRFGWDRVAGQYRQLYEEVLAGGNE